MIFLPPLLDVTTMSISSFFPCTAWLLNFLPIECFHVTYDLNGFKSRINRHSRFFLNQFPLCFNLFVLLFLVTPCLVVALHVNPNQKKLFYVYIHLLLNYILLKTSSFFKKKKGIHSMQGWTTIMRHQATRKRSTIRLLHTRNLFKKNLQLKGVCQF